MIAEGLPKVVKDIWTTLVKTELTRHTEIICPADDVAGKKACGIRHC